MKNSFWLICWMKVILFCLIIILINGIAKTRGQSSLGLVNTTVYYLSNQTCTNNGCGGPPVDLIPKEQVCAVIGEQRPVDCSCLGNGTINLNAIPCKFCGGDGEVLSGRFNFSTVQDALNRCPFDPIELDILGTHYVASLIIPNKTGVFFKGFLTQVTLLECHNYNASDYTVSELEELGIDFDTQMRAAEVNSTRYVIKAIYGKTPIKGSPPAVLVGANWYVTNPNTTIGFENITLDGCNTVKPLFSLCSELDNLTDAVNGSCGLPEPAWPPPPPPPPPKPQDPCEFDNSTVTDCKSTLGFRMNCTRIIRPAGPCYDKNGVLSNCTEKITHRWNCSDEESLLLGIRYSCFFNTYKKKLYDCRDLPPETLGALYEIAYEEAKKAGCPGCRKKPKRGESYAICKGSPMNNTGPPPPCRGCLLNNDFIFLNSTMRNYRGRYAVKMHGMEENIKVWIEDSNFVDIPGTAFWADGLESYVVISNLMARCGGLPETEACLYLKGNYISRSDYIFIGNVQWARNRTLPFPCDYNYNGEVRCHAGNLECVNFVNATLNDCDYLSIDGDRLLNEDCAAYQNCPCNQQTVQNTGGLAPNGTNFTADGITVRVTFDLTTLGLPYNINDTVFFPCQATGNTTAGTGQLPPPNAGGNVYVGASLCPVANLSSPNATNPTNCSQSQTCPCPTGPGDRQEAQGTCSSEIGMSVMDLTCESGIAFCPGVYFPGFLNYTVLNGSIVAGVVQDNITDDLPDMSFLIPNVEALPPYQCNGTNNTVLNVSSCNCPHLNITRDPVTMEVLAAEVADPAYSVGSTGKDALNNTWTIEDSYSFSFEGTNLTCNQGWVSCSCDEGNNGTFCWDENGGGTNGTSNCTASYFLDHIEDTATDFQIQNNVAEGLNIGLHIRDISLEMINNHSIKVPRWKNENSTLHEIVRQNNWFLIGNINDTLDGTCRDDYPWFWNNRVCNDNCTMFRPIETIEACGVDQRYSLDTVDFNALRFNSIQVAMKNCPLDAIIVHGGHNVWNEILIFNRSNFAVISYNNAVIVSSNNTIATSGSYIRGLVFHHPAENPLAIILSISVPPDLFNYRLFGQSGGLGGKTFNNVTNTSSLDIPTNTSILNCRFYGQNVAVAGAIVGQFGGNMTIRDNWFFNFFTVNNDLYGLDLLDYKDNYHVNIFGWVIRSRGLWTYQAIRNYMINCRGISGASGVQMMLFETVDLLQTTGSNIFNDSGVGSGNQDPEDLDDNFQDAILNPAMGCNYAYNSSQLPCWFAANIQATSSSVTDMQDICFSLRGGNITKDWVYDNMCVKSFIGIEFVWIQEITYPDRYEIFLRNPLIRPSIFNSSKLGGPDGVISDYTYKRPGSLVALVCNFPNCRDWPTYPANYTINKNYKLGLTPFYGFDQFNNVTFADNYANMLLIAVDTPYYQDIYNYTVLMTQVNGSRFSRERVVITRNMILKGDYYPCDLQPVILGSNHLANQPFYFNCTSVTFGYDDYNRTIQGSRNPRINSIKNGLTMWTSNSVAIKILVFNDTRFVGRQQEAAGRVRIMDINFDAEEGILFFTHCWAYDWYSLPPGTKRLNKLVTVETRRVVVVELPDGTIKRVDKVSGTEGFFFQWGQSVRINPFLDTVELPPQPSTSAVVVDNVFVDLDGTSFSVAGMANARIQGNAMINSGARMNSGRAGLIMQGLYFSTGNYSFDGNYFEMSRSPLFPQTGTLGTGQQGATHFAAFDVSNLCNASAFSLSNNTAVVRTPDDELPGRGTVTTVTSGQVINGNNVTGADYGIRFSNICPRVYFLALPKNWIIYFPFFRKDLVPLRELVNLDNDFEGIVCDVIICNAYQDMAYSTQNFPTDCICCQDGCIVPPPAECVVDRDNKTFVPGNPYFGTYLFVSLNDAVVNCTAPSRIIRVRKQKTPYIENLILMGPGNFSILGDGNIPVFTTAGIRVMASNLSFEGLRFNHNGALATFIFDGGYGQFIQSIFFKNVTFYGGGTYQQMTTGLCVNASFINITASDYLGDYGLQYRSNCAQYNQFILEKSYFRRFDGAAIWITNLQSYEVTTSYFMNCGARRPGINPMVYLQGCFAPNCSVSSLGPIRFERVQSNQNTSDFSIYMKGVPIDPPTTYSYDYSLSRIIMKPDCGYATTFYFDGIPSTKKSSTNAQVRIRANQSDGLPVGMRFDNLPLIDTTNTPFGAVPRFTLQQFAVEGNSAINGTWNDMVLGPPCIGWPQNGGPVNGGTYQCVGNITEMATFSNNNTKVPGTGGDSSIDSGDKSHATCNDSCPFDFSNLVFILLFLPLFLICMAYCVRRCCVKKETYEMISTVFGSTFAKRKFWFKGQYTNRPHATENFQVNTNYVGPESVVLLPADVSDQQSQAVRWMRKQYERSHGSEIPRDGGMKPSQTFEQQQDIEKKILPKKDDEE